MMFDPERSCIGKKRYPEAEPARHALARSALHSTTRGLHAYHCDYCRGWHIGHKTAHVRARLEAPA